ncbi:MAG: alpha/beta hydrolase, partial [Terriglobales bacterium]
DYFSALAARVNASPRREVLLFIHGFNFSFAEAAERTAQLQYDLDFEGPAVLYSWTSRASARPSRYQDDERSVEAGLDLLVSFLKDLQQRARPERIHVIAHSMGGRALLRALDQIAGRSAERPRLGQIILAAPDMDRDEFIGKAPAIIRMCERVTLYASTADRALAIAGDAHKVPRAGESGEFVVVLPGVDTVDVSAVGGGWFTFGHSYYGENRAVLGDLYQLIHHNTPPEKRFNLFRMPHKDGHYWAFRK